MGKFVLILSKVTICLVLPYRSILHYVIKHRGPTSFRSHGCVYIKTTVTESECFE